MQSENKTYSAADIERYHAGQMPAHEMHALEKAALEDPFLADALEGYQFTATPASDLQAIREKLFGKDEEIRKPVFGFPQWLKVAAILLVLAGGTWLALSVLPVNNDSLAVQDEKKPGAQAPVKPEPTITVTDSGNDASKLSEEQPSYYTDGNTIAKQPEAGTKKIQGNFAGSNKPERSKAPRQALPAVTAAPPVEIAATTFNNDSILMNRVAMNDRNYSAKEIARVRGVENRNADMRNRSLPMLENNNQVVRNQDGYYRNTQADTVTSNVAQRKTLIDTNQHINIVMQPAKDQLAEVVVLGSGTKAKESMMRRVVIDSLEPAEGWANFDDYIASNIKEPEEIKFKKQPGGEVELSFEVNRKGEPVNIAVVKSLCTKCDEEAIRLLKEGPRWKKNKNGKGRITIRF